MGNQKQATITAVGNTVEEVIKNVIEALEEIREGEKSQHVGRYSFEVENIDI